MGIVPGPRRRLHRSLDLRRPRQAGRGRGWRPRRPVDRSAIDEPGVSEWLRIGPVGALRMRRSASRATVALHTAAVLPPGRVRRSWRAAPRRHLGQRIRQAALDREDPEARAARSSPSAVHQHRHEEPAEANRIAGRHGIGWPHDAHGCSAPPRAPSKVELVPPQPPGSPSTPRRGAPDRRLAASAAAPPRSGAGRAVRPALCSSDARLSEGSADAGLSSASTARRIASTCFTTIIALSTNGPLVDVAEVLEWVAR